MSRYYYGKDLKISFFYENDALPSSDSPAIYLFSDTPSRDIARAGTGALQSVTSWVEGNEPDEKIFDLTAIADPDPNGSEGYHDYSIAINYKLKTSGQAQCKIYQLRVRRPEGSLQRNNVKLGDLEAVYPLLLEYVTPEVAETFLSVGLAEVKSDMAKKGIDWSQVVNRDDFKLAICFKCISEWNSSQFSDQGDKYFVRYKEYQARYESALDSLPVKLDSTLDGETDAEVKVVNRFLVNLR